MTLTNPKIAHLRLANQRISRPFFENPEAVVDWLGAVQAQDYFGSKWALGLRMRTATDNDIDKAFNEGKILRTHILRPTWHFVTPVDIRWMLTLTAPHVHATNALMYRRLELDGPLFKRSNDALAKALEGGKHLTRNELRDVLRAAGIDSGDNLRTTYLVMHAELDGVICSGPRRGKQFTYALLDERVLRVKTMAREAALAELTRRYFRSRGPATVQDFAKWSGLPMADARNGLDAVKNELEHEDTNGQEYWFWESDSPGEKLSSPVAHLISVFDEYITSYKDRSAINGNDLAARFAGMGNALQYIILMDGQLAGTWKRTLKKDSVSVKLDPLTSLSEAESQVLVQAVRRYGAFLELQTVLV